MYQISLYKDIVGGSRNHNTSNTFHFSICFSFFLVTIMGRKKVKLAFIANNTKRITTFRKRKKSLMKKAEELNTLCGIEACTIV